MDSPDIHHAQDLFHEGNRLAAAGDAAAAEARYREALALWPGFAEAYANLGLLLETRDADDEAQAAYECALALDIENAQTHQNLGVLLAKRKRLIEAETAYQRAIWFAPESAPAWSNLCALYGAMHRDAEAEGCARKALSIAPDYEKARFNLAYVLLRQGRWGEGWDLFESRDWYHALQQRLGLPRWLGEPLDGRRLLVGYEAGHGDMIQFSRYLALLRARGAGRVGLLCHPALKALFATLPGADALYAFDEAVPTDAWDAWVPLLSLPRLFDTRVDTVPAPTPYLQAAPERLARWAPRLPAPGAGLRVGLAWKGNPRFENDADRSLASLALLAPLAEVPGVQFVSLQKGAGEDEARNPPPGLSNLSIAPLGQDAQDFADTAAIIAPLDLVISVDTAAAHLAGALGRPCWLLLPHYLTDWRWLDARDDSPWYPGMRLFRQGPGEDWPAVIARVRDALIAWSGQVSPPGSTV